MTSSEELLKGLLEEMKVHGRRHRRREDDDQCRKMLSKVKQIVSSIAKYYLVPGEAITQRQAVFHLSLELINALLAGSFCPHAKAVFDYGEVSAVGPLFVKLFLLLAESQEPLLLSNIDGLLALLANCDMVSLFAVFQDLASLQHSLVAEIVEQGPELLTRDEGNEEHGEDKCGKRKNEGLTGLATKRSVCDAFPRLTRLCESSQQGDARREDQAKKKKKEMRLDKTADEYKKENPATFATAELDLSTRARRMQISATANRVLAIFVRDFNMILCGQPAFRVVMETLESQIQTLALLRHREEVSDQESNLIASSMDSLRLIFFGHGSSHTMFSGGFLAADSMSRLHVLLLQVTLDWIHNTSDSSVLAQPGGSHFWQRLSAVLETQFTSTTLQEKKHGKTWGAVEQSRLIIACVRGFAQANERLVCQGLPVLLVLVRQFEAFLPQNPDLIRTLASLCSSKHVLLQRKVHASLARCVGTFLNILCKSEPDGGGAFLLKVLSVARKRRQSAPLHVAQSQSSAAPTGDDRPQMGLPFSIAPRSLSNMILARASASTRKRHYASQQLPAQQCQMGESRSESYHDPRVLSSPMLRGMGALQGPSDLGALEPGNNPIVLGPLLRESLFECLVHLCTSCLGCMEPTPHEHRRMTAEAGLSVLSHALLGCPSSNLDPQHGLVRAVLEACSTWLRQLFKTGYFSSLSMTSKSWTANIAVDICLVLVLFTQQTPERSTEPLHVAMYYAISILRQNELFCSCSLPEHHEMNGPTEATSIRLRESALKNDVLMELNFLPQSVGIPNAGFSPFARKVASVTTTVWGHDALAKSLDLKIAERLLVLGSNFPADWFVTELLTNHTGTVGMLADTDQLEGQEVTNACIRILGSSLLSAEHTVKLRAQLQLPCLLTNMRIRMANLQAYCDNLIQRHHSASEAAGSSQSISTASQIDQGGDRDLQTLRGFLSKLGSWIMLDISILEEAEPEFEPLQSSLEEWYWTQSMQNQSERFQQMMSAVYTSARINSLPIMIESSETSEPMQVDDVLTVDLTSDKALASRSSTRTFGLGELHRFSCFCHTGDKYRPCLGDVPGSLLLFKQWLYAVFFDVLPSSTVFSQARVAMIHCCCSMFRRVVHVGAVSGCDTVLETDRFGEMFSTLLGLLEDPDEAVRKAVAEEVSLFVEGCGAGVSFFEGVHADTTAGSMTVEEEETLAADGQFLSVPEDAPGRCNLLRSLFKHETQTQNVSAFMKTLRHLVGKHQKDQELIALESSQPVSHTLLHAIGTIGCTADVTYSVDGASVGSNFLSWALLMLTQQYAVGLVWSHEIIDQIHGIQESIDSEEAHFHSHLNQTQHNQHKSGDTECGQERRKSLSKLSRQLETAESLKRIVIEQFARIAKAHGFFRPNTPSDQTRKAQQRSNEKGVAIRKLFGWMRKSLYTQLFVMLFTEPLASKAPGALEEMLFTIFEYSPEEDVPGMDSVVDRDSQGGLIASSNSCEADQSMQNQDLDQVARLEHAKSVFVSRFVRESLPFILPDLLREMNQDVLFQIARRLYQRQVSTSEERDQLVKRLMLEHVEAWVVDLVELVAQDKNACNRIRSEEDKPTSLQDVSSKVENEMAEMQGYQVWKRILNFGRFSLSNIVELSQRTILARVCLRLVDINGVPDEGASRVLDLLAEFAHFQRAAKSGGSTSPSSPIVTTASTIPNSMSSFKAQTEDPETLVVRLIHSEFMYMMGILSDFIQDRWKPVVKRCHALRCARHLQSLLKGNVDVYLPNILPTVKTALDEGNPQIQLEACEMMHELVQLLSISTLQSNLSSLVVALLPCLKPIGSVNDLVSGGGTSTGARVNATPRGGKLGFTAPSRVKALAQTDSEQDSEDLEQLRLQVEEKAVRTIRWLVVSKKDELHKSFADIREILPTSHHALKDISSVLVGEQGPSSLEARLTQLIKLIQHESDNVRLIALGELREVLITNVANVHNVLLDKSISSTSTGESSESKGGGDSWSRMMAAAEANEEEQEEQEKARRASTSGKDKVQKTSSLEDVDEEQINSFSIESNENDRKGRLLPLLSELIGTLLRVSRTVAAGGYLSRSKERITRLVRLACSECLGELGAIDPSRLDQSIVHKALTSKAQWSLASPIHRQRKSGEEAGASGLALDMGNEALAAYIIEAYLVDALRAAPDPHSQMQVGMAIQELLRFFKERDYAMVSEATDTPETTSMLDSQSRRKGPSQQGGVQSNHSGESKKPISRVLSEEVIQIVRPFWNTSYFYTHERTPTPKGRGGERFFGPEVSFETSVASWYVHLAFKSSGEQSKILRALLVLQTYGGATDLFLFLLPYAIQNVLCLGDDTQRTEATSIREEIMDILRETWRGMSCPGDDEGFETRMHESQREHLSSTRESEASSSSAAAEDSEGQKNVLGELPLDATGRIKKSAHVMFYLYDTLAAWEKQMNIATRHVNRQRTAETGSMRDDNPGYADFAYDGDFQSKAPVASLLRRITVRCLAEAAFRCGAYARALKYFEIHLRSTHAMEKAAGGAIAPGSWSPGQEIQFERDEITFLHALYASLENEPDGLFGVATLRSRHDGGPGTGFVLGNTKRTVSTWAPAEDQQAALEQVRNRYMVGSRRYQNRILQPPAGTQPGDGGQPTLEEKIYELEFSGRWDEAIACYERMLSQIRAEKSFGETADKEDRGGGGGGGTFATPTHPNKRARTGFFTAVSTPLLPFSKVHDLPDEVLNAKEMRLQQGRLRCLRRLAHLDVIVSMVRGASGGLKTIMEPYSLEALWRLGRWGDLEGSLDKSKTIVNQASSTALGGQDIRLLDAGPGNMGSMYSDAVARAMFALAKSTALQDRNAEEEQLVYFKEQLDKAKLQVMEILSAVSMESYFHAYPMLLRLQALAELQKGWEVVSVAKRHRLRPVLGVLGASPVARNAAYLNVSRRRIEKVLPRAVWENRFKVTVPSVEMREELFEVRRVIYQLAGLKVEEMTGWLSLAKTARVAGHMESCLAALQRVQECANDVLSRSDNFASSITKNSSVAVLIGQGKIEAEVALCKAKIYLAELYANRDSPVGRMKTSVRGGIHDALMILEPVQPDLDAVAQEAAASHPLLRKSRAKSLLLATNLMAESCERSGQHMIARYKTIQNLRPNWPKSTFHLAKLFEGLLENFRREEEEGEQLLSSSARTSDNGAGSALRGALSHRDSLRGSGGGDDGVMKETQLITLYIMKSYSKSLENGGFDQLYESLPRLLTLWYTETEALYPRVSALEEARAAATSSKSPLRRSGKHRQSAAATLLASGGSGSTRGGKTDLDGMSSDEMAFKRMNSLMTTLCEVLPAYVWYTAIPQLVSRLGVESKDVWSTTKAILVKIMHAYPAQAFWHVMGVMKSNVEERKERAEEMFHDLISTSLPPNIKQSDGQSTLDLKAQFQSAGTIFNYLIHLARYDYRQDPKCIPRHEKTSNRVVLDLNQVEGFDMRTLRRAFAVSALCLPTQDNLSATLPNQKSLNSEQQPENEAGTQKPGSSKRKSRKRGSMLDTKPLQVFGTRVPLVTDFSKRVEIMQSKEKPKKIVLKGSNGTNRDFLCKNESRGDLRKDSRAMEFTSVVNRLFERDPQARKRKLRLRTFSVICLNENCGLIEWVENTAAFRHVIQYVYREEGELPSIRRLIQQSRAALDAAQNSRKSTRAELMRDVVRKFRQVCQSFPPMLHKWFLNHFLEPEAWLEARTLYTRSCAVWSMVGYVVGLGDRHAENMLIDISTGECVHVDFDCLFDKGLTLAKPEIVPFRLTRHMVDGMDLCGVDGVFRRTCEVAMQVLRDNKNMLLSVLESFVVDPLVEWTRVKQTQGKRTERGAKKKDTRQAKFPPLRDAHKGKLEAQSKMRDISERLDGIVRQKLDANVSSQRIGRFFDIMPLSTQGQVHLLIEQATKEENLSQLYSGWCAFL